MTDGFTWLRCGWLMDGTGRAPQKDMLLGVEKGIIACLAAAPSGSPDPHPLLDFSNATLLPGLMDCHVHLFMSGTADPAARSFQQTRAFGEIESQITQRLVNALACGVVAVRDGGDAHAHALRYHRACHRFDELPVRIRTAGRAWHRNGRYGKFIGGTPRKGEALGDAIRHNGHPADHIKIINSGINSLTQFGRETPPQFGSEELRQAVRNAKTMACTTMVHANGREAVACALQAGCDSIEHGFFMGRKNLQQMAERQTTWVPTAVTMQAYLRQRRALAQELCSQSRSQKGDAGKNAAVCDTIRRTLDAQLEQMRLARELGVTIAVGTDAGSPGVHHGRAVMEEIGLLMTAGYSAAQAVQCATQHAARLLGLHDYGRIAAGMSATFVLAPGSPQDLPQSLGKIAALFIKGRRYPSMSAF